MKDIRNFSRSIDEIQVDRAVSMPKFSHGNGCLGYGLMLDQSEKVFTFKLEAFPESLSALREKKGAIRFECTYPLDEASISQLKEDIKVHFLDKFTNPEEYFDKVKSLKMAQESDCQYLGAREGNKVNMTHSYLNGQFDVLYKNLNHAVETMELSERCTIF